MLRKTPLILLLALLVALPAGLAFAGALTVDGRVTADDGYTMMWNLSPSSGTPSAAQLYMSQDSTTKNVFIAFVLPTDFVDNSYGTEAIGWPGKGHTFDQLVGSDKLDVDFSENGKKDPILGVVFDYLSASGSDYISGVTGTKDGELNPNGGVANAVPQAKSSLDYNINTLPGGSAYTVNSPHADADYSNPALAGWIFNVIYEFEIDGDVFNNNDILGPTGMVGYSLKVVELHASPKKDGEFKGITPGPGTPITPTPPSGGAVPLPSGVWAGCILLVGLGLVRAQRRRKERLSA